MPLQSVDNPYDSQNPVNQIINNSLRGWGYNFYNQDNQLEADDRLIRTKISDYLGLMRTALRNYDAVYRAEFLPPPTSANPFPDSKAIAFVKKIKKTDTQLEHVETMVRGASTPGGDKNWQRHRDQRETLATLARIDEALMVKITDFHRELGDIYHEESLPKLDTFLQNFESEFKKRQEFLRIQLFKENIHF
jgi:hypothetical protein